MGAVLLWLRGDLTTTTTELDKFDGFIGKHGDNFHDSVQKAYDSNKACMLFMESRPDIMCNDRQLNPDNKSAAVQLKVNCPPRLKGLHQLSKDNLHVF